MIVKKADQNQVQHHVNLMQLCLVEILKKIAAFLLLVIYMLSATATKELMKFPLLAQHFYDHVEENRNTGLVSFLLMHYYVEDGTDKDAAEDNQLPFKSAEYAAVASFTSLAPPAGAEISVNPFITDSHSFATYTDLFLPSQYLAAIWQPPRHC